MRGLPRLPLPPLFSKIRKVQAIPHPPPLLPPPPPQKGEKAGKLTNPESKGGKTRQRRRGGGGDRRSSSVWREGGGHCRISDHPLPLPSSAIHPSILFLPPHSLDVTAWAVGEGGERGGLSSSGSSLFNRVEEEEGGRMPVVVVCFHFRPLQMLCPKASGRSSIDKLDFPAQIL